jgi:hypothetical protein
LEWGYIIIQWITELGLICREKRKIRKHDFIRHKVKGLDIGSDRFSGLEVLKRKASFRI